MDGVGNYNDGSQQGSWKWEENGEGFDYHYRRDEEGGMEEDVVAAVDEAAWREQ